MCVAFLFFDFERNYDVLKSKSRCNSLSKTINFNKNQTESKMENPKHSFRETKCVFQFISESKTKSKNYYELELAKEKRGHFL